MTDLLISLLIWLKNVLTAGCPVMAPDWFYLRQLSLCPSIDTAEKRYKGCAEGIAILSDSGPTRELSLRRWSFARQHTPLFCYVTKFGGVSRSSATVPVRTKVLSCRHFEKTFTPFVLSEARFLLFYRPQLDALFTLHSSIVFTLKSCIIVTPDSLADNNTASHHRWSLSRHGRL